MVFRHLAGSVCTQQHPNGEIKLPVPIDCVYKSSSTIIVELDIDQVEWKYSVVHISTEGSHAVGDLEKLHQALYQMHCKSVQRYSALSSRPN